MKIIQSTAALSISPAAPTTTTTTAATSTTTKIPFVAAAAVTAASSSSSTTSSAAASKQEALVKTLRSAIAGSQIEDAFFLVDLGDVYRKHQQWLRLMPGIAPFYAVKCCNEEVILRSLASLGCNFDCASQGEIAQILKLGVDASRIIYANPAKPIPHIRYARSVGVSLMTFDNEYELAKIKEHYPEAQLVLRILADDPHAHCSLGAKFGAQPAAAPALLRAAKSLGLAVVGVSFHVGSGCSNPSAFRNAIAAARGVFRAAAALGFTFTLLDLGGGFPGVDSPKVCFKDIANVVADALAENFADVPNLRVIAEPGRYYAASSCTLAVCVTSKRALLSNDVEAVETVKAEQQQQQFMYYVNDGLYGSLNCVIYDQVVPAPKLLQPAPRSAAVYESTLWGPTCDSMDVIAKGIMLPELNVGDWLYFENQGAYTLAAGTTFNGFERAKYIYTFTTTGASAIEAAALPADHPVRSAVPVSMAVAASVF